MWRPEWPDPIRDLDRVYMTVSDRMAARILAKCWHYGPGSAEVLGEWAP